MGYQIERRDKCRLYYEPGDRDVAHQAYEALESALVFIRKRWGLPEPDHLHMVMMTGWWSYMLATAPLPVKISLWLLYPIYALRIRRLWKFAGGWQNQFGRRRVVGIKPPRLIESADRSIGKRIYVESENLPDKMRQIVYHEIAHACAAHLRLPAWLNEGLAMVTVDGIVGWQTVKSETLETLDRGGAVARGRAVAKIDPETLVAHYVRGYWVTRYFAETQPDLLPSLLQRRLRRSELEKRLAQAVGISPGRFWSEIEGRVKAHFLVTLSTNL